MPGKPQFIGPVERRRFTMLHDAGPAARGAVLVCPPLGYDGVNAHAALLSLAEQLRAESITTLRLEYDGTGNSVGDDHEPDRVEGWLSSVRDGVDHLCRLGHDRVTVLGVRTGALLASVATAGSAEVDRLVLWDPVVSGRRWVRTQTMLAATTAGGSSDGDLRVTGLTFTRKTLADLKRLGITGDALPGSCLVVEPLESPTSDWAITLGSGEVEVVRCEGTAALLETDVELSVVPEDLLATIVRHEVDHRRSHPAPPMRIQEHQTAAVAVEQVGDHAVEHHAVRIGGERELFGVVTAVPGAGPRLGIVMLNNGAAAQLGPGRAWVEWAKALAGEGFVVLRLDVSGLGDSPPAPGAASHDSYPLAAAQDARAGLEYLRSLGCDRVAVLGLCSGAFVNFDVLVSEPEVDAVVSINTRFDRPWSGSRREFRQRAAGRTNPLLAVPLMKGPLFPLFDRVPRLVWWLLDRLRLVASPTRALAAVSGHRARVLLVFGEHEWGLRALRRRSPADFDRYVARAEVRCEVVPGLDHSMFEQEKRDRVFALVRDFLHEVADRSERQDGIPQGQLRRTGGGA